MKKKGFTLIELLIVVAIIGILAAIAIPNFLNAQVRAKVARTQADMQAIATSLETYRVDNNEYPEQGMGGYTSYMNMSRLTTPIKHISSVEMLLDPFLDHGPIFMENMYRSWNFKFLYPSDPTKYEVFLTKYGHWRMLSAGPDGQFSTGYQVYDPSNGTTSAGLIMRSQKHAKVK